MKTQTHFITVANAENEAEISDLFKEIVLKANSLPLPDKIRAVNDFNLRARIDNWTKYGAVIAFAEHEIVGFACGEFTPKAPTKLEWIGVRDDFRGWKVNGGHSTFSDLMMIYLIGRAEVTQAPGMEAMVHQNDVHALRAFKRWGFSFTGMSNADHPRRFFQMKRPIVPTPKPPVH